MAGQNDVSIKIGDVTLSTGNIPKNGIDLTKLSVKTQETLSIFDSNKDGKLSKTEINNAILEFSQADKTYSTTQTDGNKTITTTTHKDGEVDNYELEHNIKEKTIDRKELCIEAVMLMQEGYSREEAEVIVSNFGQDTARYQTRKLSSSELKESAKALQKVLAREEAMKKGGLQETYNENWLKDAEGNHYRYNEQTLKFEKIDNVDSVAEDGSYRTYVKNEKAQQIISLHNADGSNVVQVLNYENKAYKNPDYAANVAGLTKFVRRFGSGYKNENDGTVYIWNDQKHIFENDIRVNKIFEILYTSH